MAWSSKGRNIPAHAGKTLVAAHVWCATKEHPRARGENYLPFCALALGRGTSPRTRGKLPRSAAPPPGRRNIPAHAGKTKRCVSSVPKSTEHPRARGENERMWHRTQTFDGTSPRTRGKPSSRFRKCARTRNIPAHAGKTSYIGHSLSHTEEHPRARGENIITLRDGRGRDGTSPRTRGKQQTCSHNLQGYGNIPAHAGKTYMPGC